MSKTNEANFVKTTVNQTKAAKAELGKTTAATPRVIRNFTYELHDVENIFTSKISFFLTELNKQLNALVNSNIYTKNKDKLDKVLKSKSDFRKALLHLLKTEYTDFYQKYYFEAKIFGNKAKYFRTVIEEYRRILLSRLSRQTVIDMIVNNSEITYQEVFNKLCELNDGRSDKDYKFNWISKAEFNNIIKQVSNSSKIDYIDDENTVSQQVINVYAIDYSIEDDQISEFNLTESEDKEYYLIEFKLKYSDYTTQSDSLLTYKCKIPKKQIKGLITGYTKLKKFTRPRIFLRNPQCCSEAGSNSKDSEMPLPHKLCIPYTLYISFNYELEVARSHSEQTIVDDTWQFKTMGIDIGVSKSSTAAIMNTNMYWAEQSEATSSSSEAVEQSKTKPEQTKLVAIDFTQPVAISNELTISDKTQSVSEHIEKLKDEQNYIYKKEKAIYDLLKLKAKQPDDGEALVNHAGDRAAVSISLDSAAAASGVAAMPTNSTLLLHKYQILNKHRLHLRNKVSNLKKNYLF